VRHCRAAQKKREIKQKIIYQNSYYNTMKKVFLNLVFIFTSIFSVAQTELQNAKEKPLNETEIKNSYVFKNKEDKYKSSELVKSIPVTDYDLTKVFLSEIEKVLDSANNLKINVKDSEELETLNKNIYFLKNLQYNITSTNDIVYYKAVMKYTNYSNLVTIDTLNVEPIIEYHGKVGGYEKNRLKWLRNARENITTLNHLTEREKFNEISSDVKYINEKENKRKLKNNDEVENQIYTFEELDKLPEFAGGINNFESLITKNFQTPKVENEIKGKVITEFTIYKDGGIGNFKIIQDVGFGCGEELIKVIKKLPRWKPGEKNGMIVNSKYQTEIILNKLAE
jgi:hypothetical protein